MGFWVAKGIVLYQKNYKDSPLLARHFLSSEMKQPIWRGAHPGCLVPQRLAADAYPSLQGFGLAAFQIKVDLIINPTAGAQPCRINPPFPAFLPAFNPGAHFSSLLVNVFVTFFFLYEKTVQADTFLLNGFLNGF